MYSYKKYFLYWYVIVTIIFSNRTKKVNKNIFINILLYKRKVMKLRSTCKDYVQRGRVHNTYGVRAND